MKIEKIIDFSIYDINNTKEILPENIYNNLCKYIKYNYLYENGDFDTYFVKFLKYILGENIEVIQDQKIFASLLAIFIKGNLIITDNAYFVFKENLIFPLILHRDFGLKINGLSDSYINNGLNLRSDITKYSLFLTDLPTSLGINQDEIWDLSLFEDVFKNRVLDKSIINNSYIKEIKEKFSSIETIGEVPYTVKRIYKEYKENIFYKIYPDLNNKNIIEILIAYLFIKSIIIESNLFYIKKQIEIYTGFKIPYTETNKYCCIVYNTFKDDIDQIFDIILDKSKNINNILQKYSGILFPINNKQINYSKNDSNLLFNVLLECLEVLGSEKSFLFINEISNSISFNSPDNFIFYIFNNFKKWDLFNYKYECEPLLDSDIKDISIKYLEYFENSLEMNLDSYIQKSNDYKIFFEIISEFLNLVYIYLKTNYIGDIDLEKVFKEVITIFNNVFLFNNSVSICKYTPNKLEFILNNVLSLYQDHFGFGLIDKEFSFKDLYNKFYKLYDKEQFVEINENILGEEITEGIPFVYYNGNIYLKIDFDMIISVYG